MLLESKEILFCTMFFFIKYLSISIISLTSIEKPIENRKISIEKSYTYPLNSALFMFSTAKAFEMIPKHNGYGFICKSFA